jgi:hypothetical protein
MYLSVPRVPHENFVKEISLQKQGEKIFSDQQLGMKFYMKLIVIMELE